MTEQEIAKVLKSRFADLKTLKEKLSLSTKEQEEELLKALERMRFSGIVGKHDKSYYLLEDQRIFLAEVTLKTRNFVILKAIPEGFECKIAGREGDGLLVGDLVYAKEFQEGVFHCLDYLKAVETLKGYYSLTKGGQEQLQVPYLNDCGKTVLIDSRTPTEEAHQGDLCSGKIVNVNRDFIYVTIEKVLVRANEVGGDISSILAMNDAPLSFPESAMDEAKKMPQEVSPEERIGREDFRDHLVVTIDGDDAHDFDDAVEGKKVLNGYEVTVHIADVTHYLKKNHPLDDEAYLRGTSIYVADRVVPMLPFELSNGICSLNPNVDRLTLSVTMQVDGMGHVFSTRIQEGVIRSKARLTYKEVNGFLRGEDKEWPDELKEMLSVLSECAKKVRKRRTMQGAMELESTELKFRLDEKGTPVEVLKCEQGESEKMIEDLMILANCAVARELKRNKIPVLYRIHEFPPQAKIEVLRDYLKKMSLIASFPRTQDITGARLNDFLSSISDKEMRKSVSTMILRSMAKARYSPEEEGHFGLAEMDYCHFTSPIRRYPDDIIHRLVKDYLIGGKKVDSESFVSKLEEEGAHLSRMEIRADEIEREVDDLESAKYMANHIGELFHGRVSGFIKRGMFIELDNGIEGFLSFHCMHGDNFRYDEKSFRAFGKRTEISFALGTPIDVTMMAARPEEGQIDFATPEFYQQNCLHLTPEQRENLALNGIQVYHEGEEPSMTGKPTFRKSNKPRLREKDDFNRSRKEKEDQDEEVIEEKGKAGFVFHKKVEKKKEDRFERKPREEKRRERKVPSDKGYQDFKPKKRFDDERKRDFHNKDGRPFHDRDSRKKDFHSDFHSKDRRFRPSHDGRRKTYSKDSDRRPSRGRPSRKRDFKGGSRER